MSRPVLPFLFVALSLSCSVGINRGVEVGDSSSEGGKGSVGGARRRREGPSSSGRWSTVDSSGLEVGWNLREPSLGFLPRSPWVPISSGADEAHPRRRRCWRRKAREASASESVDGQRQRLRSSGRRQFNRVAEQSQRSVASGFQVRAKVR